jgi:hypothetical protein
MDGEYTNPFEMSSQNISPEMVIYCMVLDEKFRGSVEKKDMHHPIAEECPENRTSI